MQGWIIVGALLAASPGIDAEATTILGTDRRLRGTPVLLELCRPFKNQVSIYLLHTLQKAERYLCVIGTVSDISYRGEGLGAGGRGGGYWRAAKFSGDAAVITILLHTVG